MNMPSLLQNTCVLLVALPRQQPVTTSPAATVFSCSKFSNDGFTNGNLGDFSRSPDFKALVACRLRVPVRPQPEQTGTVDVVVLKELKPILFRVPVLFAHFEGRL